MPVTDHLKLSKSGPSSSGTRNASPRRSERGRGVGSRAGTAPPASSGASSSMVNSAGSRPSWESLPPALRMSAMKQEAKRLSSAKENAREEAAVVHSAIQEHRQHRVVIRKVKKKVKKKVRVKKSPASENPAGNNSDPNAGDQPESKEIKQNDAATRQRPAHAKNKNKDKDLGWQRQSSVTSKSDGNSGGGEAANATRNQTMDVLPQDFETENERYVRLQKEREERAKRQQEEARQQKLAQKSPGTMQAEADAMRKRLAAMGIAIKSPKTPKTPRNPVVSTKSRQAAPAAKSTSQRLPSTTPFHDDAKPTKSNADDSNSNSNNSNSSSSRPKPASLQLPPILPSSQSNHKTDATNQHSYKLIQKKLKKVEQLLEDTKLGSKQHKKYQAKKLEYEGMLRDMKKEAKGAKASKIDSHALTLPINVTGIDGTNSMAKDDTDGTATAAATATSTTTTTSTSSADNTDWIAKAREAAIEKERRIQQEKDKLAQRQRQQHAKEEEERRIHEQQEQQQAEEHRRQAEKEEEEEEERREQKLLAEAEDARREMIEMQEKLEEEKRQKELQEKEARRQELLQRQKEETDSDDDDSEDADNQFHVENGMGEDARGDGNADATDQSDEQQAGEESEESQEEQAKESGKSVRGSLTADEMAMDSTQRLLNAIEKAEKQQRKLEKQLSQNGIPISEDIPYDLAKAKIGQIQKSMQTLMAENDGSHAFQNKYYKMEEELAKYSTALMLTDEYQAEQERLEQEWESKHSPNNLLALQKIRRHMPVSIRNQSETSLTTTLTPNGKTLPKQIVRKFKRTNVLQLVRMDPENGIEKMHPSLLEGMRTTGLTLTERRALHEHLKGVGALWQSLSTDPSMDKKWMWFSALKSKFKEELRKYEQDVEKHGPPGSHVYASRKAPSAGGCTLIGNQCPVKADAALSYDEDYGFTPDAVYETTEAAKSSLPGDDAGGGGGKTPLQRQHSLGTLRKNVAKRGNYGRTSIQTTSIAELTKLLRTRLQFDDGIELSVKEEKLLQEAAQAERRAKMLEKQLTQAGFKVAEDDISYSEAKTKIGSLTEDIKQVAGRMGEVADMKQQAQLEAEYVKLAEELEKYNAAIMLTKEWEQEQKDKLQKWEAGILPANQQALRDICRHMPVNIRDLSEEELRTMTTPNGKQLPAAMVKKFKRTNVLMLLRLDPKQIEPMHPSSLEGMRTTGLTLTERRALYEHLKDLGNGWRRQANDKMVERKWMWHESLKGKYKEVLDKYEKHVAEYGQPENHPYGKKRGDPGCPLIGNQCPIKANAAMDYSGDYGFPESGIYSKSEVQKSSLLTVEEFQARQREDDDAHNEGVGDSDGSGAAGLHPPGKGALGGMLKQIFAAGP